MYLKRVQLTGFKTFADKTEIEFSPGVTAIVGPNGSGKSNIADAVLWALGEQKASAMRGAKAQDVIFAGSAGRKAMGLAEVSLTVDNTDGTLPLAFDEVTITRRALRSGDGEYLINKSPCRLKDIYELFLDTGVGREAYALVNQSEIDAVLSADPQTRRGLFEEAAGIKKYRVKKREALRRLEATEVNLTRIRDILGEVGAQLKPLRLQADLARRYLGLKESLQRIERDYLIVELRLADYEMTAARQGRQEEESAVAKHSARLAAAEARVAAVTHALAEAEEELETYRLHHQAALSHLERALSETRLAEERASSLRARSALIDQELEELAIRLRRAQDELANLDDEAGAVLKSEPERDSVLEQNERSLRALNERVFTLQRAEEKRRKEAETLARRQISEQAELARAEARVAEASSSLALLTDEYKRLQESLSELLGIHETADAEAITARQALEIAREGLAESRAEVERCQAETRRLRDLFEKKRGEALGVGVRLSSLRELETAQEGYFSGVKAVTQASAKGELKGAFTVVADAFRAPSGYELAFEVALGASLQDIITDSEEAAKAAIEFLKRTARGRATFLPLPRMRPSRADIHLGRAAKMPGLRGLALELLTFDDSFRPALEALLGRVLVCEALDDALRIGREADGWNRIVTLTGELTVPSGAITGGAAQRRGASLLERKSEIVRLETEEKAKHAEAQSAEEALIAAHSHEEAARTALRAKEQTLGEANLAASGASQQADRARRDKDQATDRADAQKRRIETAQATLATAHERVALCARLLAESASPDTSEADSEAEQIPVLLAERESLTSSITQARIEQATLKEKALGLDRARRAARTDAEQIAAQFDRRRIAKEQAERELGALVELGRERENAGVQAEQAKIKAQQDLDRAQQKRQTLLQQSYEASASVRGLQDARATALATIRQNELQEARYEAQRAALAARLLEEYDVTADYALSLPADPEVPADSPKEVARLRRELRSLGEVNAGAAEEYERLAERHEFMTVQKDDAEQAEDKIVAAIKEIDQSTRSVFMETFHAVEKAFQELFARLFNGGTAEVKLTDPNDLLETGVEIYVQPPGKKRQNLMLLSGGERALTAAALLFAFLKVRPAPFCVLDEVDAPLDGANVERFADLLRDFGTSTQFLIITHNPATMEAAPIWYGVTMQQPGISRVLSLQVPSLQVPSLVTA